MAVDDDVPLPSLPAFKKLDLTGKSSLSHLHWKVEASRAPAEKRAVDAKAKGGTIPAPLYPRQLEWEEISELHKVLTEQARGVVNAESVEEIRKNLDAKHLGKENERRDGPKMQCVNDDERTISVYASQNSLTRALSYASIEPSRSQWLSLPTGLIMSESREPADVVVCLTSAARLFPDVLADEDRDDDTEEAYQGGHERDNLDEAIVDASLVVEFDVAKPLGMQLEYESQHDRVVVHSIQKGYQAAREERIQAGMVVVTVNDQAVRNLDEFGDALRRVRAEGSVGLVRFENANASGHSEEATSRRGREWHFETEDEQRLADRVPPKVAASPVIREPSPNPAFCDIRPGDSPFYVRVRNCSTFDTLRVFCTSAERFAQQDTLLPGGLFHAALRTYQRLYLVVESGAETSAPALVLQCGSAAVRELSGYSVVWQSTCRTVSCVAQSHSAALPTKLNLEPIALATRARVRVIEEFRALRANGLTLEEQHPLFNLHAFQLTVI